MRGARSTLRMLLAIAAGGLLLAAAVGAALWRDRMPGWASAGVAVGAAAALGALWIAWSFVDAHFRRLERLQGAVLLLGGHGIPMPPPRAGRPDEIDRLELAIAELAGREIARREARDRRLGTVLGALEQGILVVTPHGQVSLLNAAAKTLFGERAAPGSSLFDLFWRESFVQTLDAAAAAGAPQRVELLSTEGDWIPATVTALGEEMGALLVFEGGKAGARRHVEHDLDLHDRPPPAAPFSHATALADLPILVLDTETTGLDVKNDRIVAVGAVRMHGMRVFAREVVDLLIRPERPIPPRAIAVHGITDAMVGSAPAFAELADRIQSICEGMVLVGHNIGFDIAMIEREMSLIGRDWPRPVALDTLNLYAALRPEAQKLDLEAVAADLGVEVRGRHTALGDALMTAEIFRRMMPSLADAGVSNLAGAIAFGLRPKEVVRRQRAAGW
ncbi:MAG: exonuclease domain-containing protein [Pseudomonadota bacterium]